MDKKQVETNQQLLIARKECFEFQLDFIRRELDTINEVIGRINQITQSLKNWTIVIWAGSISLAISQKELRPYIVLTAILPFAFWFIDAWWRRNQRQFIFRSEMISKYLNSSDLLRSFEELKMIGFNLYDPRAKKERGKPDYEKFCDIRKTVGFKTVSVFYGGLLLISIFLGLFFMFVKLNNGI